MTRRHRDTLAALEWRRWLLSTEVAAAVGYSPSRAREYLRELWEMGLAERGGNWPDGFWRWRRAT